MQRAARKLLPCASLQIAIAFIVCSLTSAAQEDFLSCENDFAGVPLDIARTAGVWYEVLRAPPSDVPACVNVTAPTSLSNEDYILQVDYINNVNYKWQPTREYLTFPWNNNTQNGIFELNYTDGSVGVTIYFKVILIQYETMAIVCGYTPISTSVNLLKIMTRQAELNATLKNQIQNIVDRYNLRTSVTFVEQTNCNAAAHNAPIFMHFFVIFLGLYAIFMHYIYLI